MSGRAKHKEGKAILDLETLGLQIGQIRKVRTSGKTTRESSVTHWSTFRRRPDRTLGIGHDLCVMCECYHRGPQGEQSKGDFILRCECYGKLGYCSSRQFAL